MAAQEGRRAKNARRAGGPAAGGGLPATLALSTGLPLERKATAAGASGPTGARRQSNLVLKETVQRAALATASMGKFDRKVQHEKPGPPKAVGKRRRFAPTTERRGESGERDRVLEATDSLLRRNAADVALDIGKAARSFKSEVDTRRAEKKRQGQGESAGRPAKGGKKGRK